MAENFYMNISQKTRQRKVVSARTVLCPHIEFTHQNTWNSCDFAEKQANLFEFSMNMKFMIDVSSQLDAALSPRLEGRPKKSFLFLLINIFLRSTAIFQMKKMWAIDPEFQRSCDHRLRPAKEWREILELVKNSQWCKNVSFVVKL